MQDTPYPQSSKSEDDCRGRRIFVSGNAKHRSTRLSKLYPEKTLEKDLIHEIHGSFILLTIPKLDPVEYQIEVELAETEFDAPNKRLFRIDCPWSLNLENIDVFQKSGGFGRSHTIKGRVRHGSDLIDGPFIIKLIGQKSNAVFTSVHLKDLEGNCVACLHANELVDLDLNAEDQIPDVTEEPIYQSPEYSTDERVIDLISRMSLKEKVAQLHNDPPAIQRLGVPAYDYWNECLHGVARAGEATVFPQAIGLAATWNAPLIKRIGDAISDEARAKHQQSLRDQDYGRYHGLTFWTPNINIFRDPRWGRGQETYGEDPFLTSRIAVSFIQGLQGEDEENPKALACAKHFAVHSGPESERHWFDANPSRKDLFDTYLPQFEAAVKEANVGILMSAYNAVYGESACSSHFLLTELLREKWGFQGHVVSDCNGLRDIYAHHNNASTPEEATVRALQAGCDLECGRLYYSREKAALSGLLPEADVDRALFRVLKSRFLLGDFDPPETLVYSGIPMSVVNSPEHQELALEAARESIVLLKNDGILPVDTRKINRIAVIGPNADSRTMLHGNYNGTPKNPVSILKGIQNRAGQDVLIDYGMGCPHAVDNQSPQEIEPACDDAIKAARAADLVVFAGGITAGLEGEQSDVKIDGFAKGDRTRIELPPVQSELLKRIHETGTPTLIVNCSGSAIALPWEDEHAAAIIQAWYPGESGGNAVADVIFGNCNPSGRLPVTFYRSTEDLPDFSDYSMYNRTYRFFEGDPLYAFGHGLSYSKFQYQSPKLKQSAILFGEDLRLQFEIANRSDRHGAEVAQVYLVNETEEDPHAFKRRLVGFERVEIRAGETVEVRMTISSNALREWIDEEDNYGLKAGDYALEVSAASDDCRLRLPISVLEPIAVI
ncbi:MAG: glycoside hydrolase family 3 C-terminal domain-containing protein [Verrucomicrobiota bacterium]